MKQRLFIFFILGILILTADLVFNDENEDKITIFESEINSLIGTWVNQVGREPTIQEVDGIIKQLLDEEILYREAIKLGLDKNDIIIKRRLAQKIGFLRQEADSTLPSEQEISDFYNQNLDKYFVGKRITFSHVYFSSSETDGDEASNALSLIQSGSSETSFGEPFLLGKNFSSKTITEIVKIAMEIVESTKLKGAEQKALVEKIVRKIIVDSPLEESKKSIVISMLDEGIVGDVIELVVSATKGELDINSVEKVATGCCLAFLKSRKSRNQKLTSNPLH